ncbi:MAG: hypothetical protein K2J72_06465, partial [Oscillospiraceae bacterium]|nr:hypothetical protein [Oscillospiraceae bacterium]
INVIGVFASAMISNCKIILFKKIYFLNKSIILSFFGRYSLEIYLIHDIIVGFAKNVLIRIGITNLLLNMLISFFLAAFIPIGFSFLLKKLNLYKPLFRPANYFADKKAEQLLNKN